MLNAASVLTISGSLYESMMAMVWPPPVPVNRRSLIALMP